MDEKLLLEQIDAFVAENEENVLRDLKTLVDINSVESEPLPGAPFGVQLDTGTALQGRLSPLMSLPTLSRFLREGHVESVWNEKMDGETLRVVELEDGDGVRLRLWQSADGTPVHAELRSGERVEITMNITKFS